MQVSISKTDVNIKSAKKWFDFYFTDGKKDFEDAFNRGSKYKGIIQAILRKYSIPDDLYYLAMTESYFNNNASSNKGAVGIWQFIPSTAKNYGLRVTKNIDERKHPIKATIAAAKYLKDLYNIFNDWALAAAAYNCGEYRVLKAIKKGGTRSFSKLALMKLLPEETINYVSKIWVTREIAYKIKGDKNRGSSTYKDISSIKLGKKELSINTLSLISELSVEDIIKHNPDIINVKSALAPEMTVYLPKKHVDLFIDFTSKKGVLSRLKKPGYLVTWGLKDAKKGDNIKITFLNSSKLKIKNVRTKEEIIIKVKDLSKI